MTDGKYFGEREGAEIPRGEMEIGREFWGGFVALIRGLVGDGSLAEKFPEHCPDGGVCGCDGDLVGEAFKAEIGSIDWPLNSDDVPETVDALEAVEFFYRFVSKPGHRQRHDYFRHEHLASFESEEARKEYQERVNTLLRRNGHPFEMVDGQIGRLDPPALGELISDAVFQTGDDKLDEMLSAARTKIRDKDPNTRREALEELWDAWERVKTLEDKDKKRGTQAILDKAAPEATLRAEIEAEAKSLTDIGNKLMIRHKETDKAPIKEEEHVDYLFYRMFSMIWMVLVRTKRAGRT